MHGFCCIAYADPPYILVCYSHLLLHRALQNTLSLVVLDYKGFGGQKADHPKGKRGNVWSVMSLQLCFINTKSCEWFAADYGVEVKPCGYPLLNGLIDQLLATASWLNASQASQQQGLFQAAASSQHWMPVKCSTGCCKDCRTVR